MQLIMCGLLSDINDLKSLKGKVAQFVGVDNQVSLNRRGL